MATARLEKVNLRLQYDLGLVDGKQKYATKTLSNIAETATDDGIYSVATGLSSLQTKPLHAARKIETTILSE